MSFLNGVWRRIRPFAIFLCVSEREPWILRKMGNKSLRDFYNSWPHDFENKTVYDLFDYSSKLFFDRDFTVIDLIAVFFWPRIAS